MDEPISPPPSEPEHEATVAPAEPEAEPDPLPPEPSNAAVEPAAQPDAGPPEPTAAPTEPVVQAELPSEPSAAPEVQSEPIAAQPPRRKRKLEEVGFENSTYFKIRTIVKNLRPSFVQVLQNPNFRETDLAGDILKEIKTVLELSKQLCTDLAVLTKPQKASSIPPVKDDPDEALQGDESSVPQTDQAENAEVLPNSDDNPLREEAGAELKDVPKNLEDGFKGSYVVGGSPVGWNYLVYPGSKPMYYGRSKAEKQARQIDNMEESVC